MASCAVTQTSQLPDECSKQLTSLGYKVKPTSWSISVFPKETSHQYVDGASKLKICASLYRKLHKKEPKEKKPLICPHCNKEAGGVVTAPVSYSALAVPDPFHGGAPENLKMHRLFISTIQWFLAFCAGLSKASVISESFACAANQQILARLCRFYSSHVPFSIQELNVAASTCYNRCFIALRFRLQQRSQDAVKMTTHEAWFMVFVI